jgi:hypothetical protein
VSTLTILHHCAVPARTPRGRAKRAGKINFMLAEGILEPIQYVKVEVKYGRKRGGS